MSSSDILSRYPSGVNICAIEQQGFDTQNEYDSYYDFLDIPIPLPPSAYWEFRKIFGRTVKHIRYPRRILERAWPRVAAPTYI